MQIFEYPYIIITIFVICFVLLGTVGIYFAMKGLKTASDHTEKDFTNISKLENIFQKSGKQRDDRCLIYINLSLDNFRSLNSAHICDNLLAQIRKILLNKFSVDNESDICINSDKNFIVLSKWNLDKARKKSEECQLELNKCLSENSALNLVDIRMGAYFASGTSISFDEAITRANHACMIAQNENIPYAEWNLSDGKALQKKIKIENNIEKEIDNNRFFLEYQPVLDAKTKKIIGAEVLSRLNSESDGVLNPANFLSAVDSVGLNNKFDYYIFEKNCKWISHNIKQRENYIYTINFSRSTLSEPSFAEKIINIAEKYDLNFSCLAVEILEDKNISEPARQQMTQNLSSLKEKGISVLLDDFGSGYTAFGDLQNLDISIVKIDKSIIRNAVNDTGFIILKNIINTAKDIGFKTLCEGIENEAQEKAAIEAGCDFFQGYYFYKPMPVAELEKLLQETHGGN